MLMQATMSTLKPSSDMLDDFAFDGAHIIGLTAEGRTTVSFLQLNAVERIIERAEFIRAGIYPPQNLS